MPLYLKKLNSSGRETYLYYPDIPNRNAFKVSSITVLRESPDRESVQELLDRGLAALAEEKKLILSFPNPLQGGWNWRLDPEEADDLAALAELQDGMIRPDDKPFELNSLGIPTLKAMLSTWHPMNDTKYWIGIGQGASMVYAMAAVKPENVAAVLGIGGELDDGVCQRAVMASVPAYLAGASPKAEAYLVRACQAVPESEDEAERIYRNEINKSQFVTASKNFREFGEELLRRAWDTCFARVRRLNTGAHGDSDFRINMEDPGFTWFLEDDSLDGRPHTWLVHVPGSIRERMEKGGEGREAALMVFYHGGSDNPQEAAEMSRFHEVGEREGFITVYPWGSDRAGWNSSMDPDVEEDVEFCRALILRMLRDYPIDPARVYLSGFSNGAAMAQTVAMLYPEMIAAICHIDSNWPGSRVGASQVDYKDVIPMALAMKKKEEYDFRMPIWYTYGTREVSYPIYRGCTQQHQYDFWKWYNHVEVCPTPPIEEPHPCGCGVEGDQVEELYPSPVYPHHFYQVNRFYTMDEEPQNYYNYVMMHDKGHEVAPMDAELGWRYVSQFRRNEDGSVGRV